jgi:hypothetical protein
MDQVAGKFIRSGGGSLLRVSVLGSFVNGESGHVDID